MFREAVGRALLPSILTFAGMLQILTISIASAESPSALRVKKDSYVVVLRGESAGVSTRAAQAAPAASRLPGFQGKRIGQSGAGQIVQYRKEMSGSYATAAAVIEDEFVQYDPADDTCARLVKELGPTAVCSPDFEVHIDTAASGESTPWGVSAINAAQAWERTTGSESVIVAVLDTGVDYTHKDLAANMWVNPREIPNNGIDDDRNGIIDDIHGMNAVDDSGDPMDDNGHGTHVAGTIGAVGGNGIGVVGINWNVKIIALKFLSASGSGSISGAIKAMDYLLELKKHGVNVRAVNNSWGGGGFSDALYDVFRRAGDAGMVLAVAAGNESNDNDASATYPASFDLDNLISVAAIDDDNNVASFSNYGATTVDIAAPGVSILSLTPGNRYQTMSGTSMATPHVTGALALLAAAAPSLTGNQLIARLYESGVPRGSLTGVVSTGRALDVGRAVYNLTEAVPNQPSNKPIYTVTQTPFDPDRSADAEPIAIQGDELEIKSVPFNFSFFGSEARRVVLSLNGLVYIDKTPADMDFRNSSKAPTGSIASLHSDLVSSNTPYGVRYKMHENGSRMTVSWRMRHYSSPSSGDVRIWLSIGKSGVIQSCTSIQPAIRSAVAKTATLGISGPSAASAVTHAYNNSDIPADMCLTYTPQGAEPEPTVPGDGEVSISKLRLSSMLGGREVSAGRRMRIRGIGAGTGEALLSATINGHACATPKSVSVRNGRSLHTALVPKNLRHQTRSRITVRMNQARATQYVYGEVSGRARGKRLSKSQLDNLCDVLMSTVR